MAKVYFYSHYIHDYVTREVKNLPEAKRKARRYGANRFGYATRNGTREFSRATHGYPYQEV